MAARRRLVITMGHQHHFLSRLDRVSLPHVERALSLYRDHDLVRFLLGHLTLPDGAERVALSLDHPERGPFLIVTREGRFVTCLGEGMKPGRLPIVTRERLDGITAKHGDLRARMEASRAFGGAQKLLTRLYDAGGDLSREEIIAASGVAPLLRRELLDLLAGASKSTRAARESILGVLRRTDKPSAAWRPVLESYYKTFWCALHLSVLFASISRDLFDLLDDAARRRLRTALTREFFEHAVDGHAARAVWTVGKLGRSLLPNYKEAWAEVTTAIDLLEVTLALTQIGLRHARTRAEVRKVIASMPPHFGRDGADEARRSWAEGMIKLTDLAFDEPERATALQRQAGAAYAVWLGAHLPPGHRYRFEKPEDVPDAIALPLAVNRGMNFLRKPQDAVGLFIALPWMARAKAEDLYPPRDYVAAVNTWPWTPEHTLHWFRPTADLHRAIRRTRPEGPTRNGPCPCGSGKKYKRCCGEAA